MPCSAASAAANAWVGPPGSGSGSTPVGRGLGDREVRRERELLQAHELRALGRGQRHALGERGPVLVRVGVPAVLHRADPERCPVRRVDPRRGVGNRRRPQDLHRGRTVPP